MGSLGPRLAASGLRGMVLDDIIPQSELFAGRLYRSREDFSLSGDPILRGVSDRTTAVLVAGSLFLPFMEAKYYRSVQ